MNFKFDIASEEMKTACEKLRFGGGYAVSFKFMKDGNGNPAVSMVTSDGISQCQSNPINVSTKDTLQDFITGILLLDVVKSIAQFDSRITVQLDDSSCRLRCGTADLTVDLVKEAVGIELHEEEQKELLAFGVLTEDFSHALDVAGMFGGSAADGIMEAAHNGTYHISFRKKDDDVKMCICSTLATAFFGYSKCKIGVMEQFEERLVNTRCILRISNLKALRDCVCDEQIAVYLTKIHLMAKDSKAMYITTLVNGSYSDKITQLGEAAEYDCRYELGRKELLTAVDCIRVGMDGMKAKDILSVDVSGGKISVRSYDERQEVTLKDTGNKEGDEFHIILSTMFFRKALATFDSDRIIFRSSFNMKGIITLCGNEDDKAVLMPIQRETVEEELKKAEKAESQKAKKGAKAAKAVDIEA